MRVTKTYFWQKVGATDALFDKGSSMKEIGIFWITLEIIYANEKGIPSEELARLLRYNFFLRDKEGISPKKYINKFLEFDPLRFKNNTIIFPAHLPFIKK